MPSVSLTRIRRALLAGALLAPLTLAGGGAFADATGQSTAATAATAVSAATATADATADDGVDEADATSAALVADTSPVDVLKNPKVKPKAAAVLQSVSAAASRSAASTTARGKGKGNGGSTNVGTQTPSGVAVGSQKIWPAYDFDTDTPYPKTFTLRGVGSKAQIWVADDRAFPEGDCRNTLGLTDITDAQITGYLNQFDSRISPGETEAFSALKARNGSDAQFTGPDSLSDGLDLPATYYKVNASEAGQVVILVDNIRDANFYRPASPEGRTFTDGYFASFFSDGTGRNVMTIDAYDWLHRTGANPPDDSSNPAYRACSAANGAVAPGLYGTSRPYAYEAKFAHEYQHMLEYDQDPSEATWVNEGLSQYAPAMLGYVNPRRSPDQSTADPSLACFSGYLGESYGGAENSLTEWGDQGSTEILCDYGAAFSFMEYLESQYGRSFLTKLHRNPGVGLAGLDSVLRQVRSRKSAMDTIHDWAVMVAVDNHVLESGTVIGGRAVDFAADTLSSKVNWSSPQSYDSPGAPPNGADFVRLRQANGRFFNPKTVSSLSFSGAATLPSAPVEWSVDGGLYSGSGDDIDRSIGRAVSVPADGGTLSFEANWSIEAGYDLASVQVSTDGGASWTSLATQDTTAHLEDDADPSISAQLPGFTGESGGWRSETADLSPYAGARILVALRYQGDASNAEDGIRVRNLTAAGQSLPTDSLDGWQTQSQLHPTPVAGWTVRLISYNHSGVVRIYDLPLSYGYDVTVPTRTLRRIIGDDPGTVAVIVMQDDPTESGVGYAPYTLTVNGVVQQGG